MQYQRVASSNDCEGRFILLVEDNKSVSEIVKNIVSMATAYHTLHVANSVEALQVLGHMKPDLLLLDYHLPTMSGVQLYDIVHAQDAYTNIPTIIITADTSQEVRCEVQKRQLILIIKPFRLAEFVDTLNSVLA